MHTNTQELKREKELKKALMLRAEAVFSHYGTSLSKSKSRSTFKQWVRCSRKVRKWLGCMWIFSNLSYLWTPVYSRAGKRGPNLSNHEFIDMHCIVLFLLLLHYSGGMRTKLDHISRLSEKSQKTIIFLACFLIHNQTVTGPPNLSNWQLGNHTPALKTQIHYLSCIICQIFISVYSLILPLLKNN